MYQIDFSKPNHVHFIGIGGSSMSGLAEYLLQKGFTVSGSDRDFNASTKKLEAHGAKILLGQSADNITDDIDLVIYTAAIHPDNPEYHAAETAGIPMLSRAQFLGQMMAQHHDSFAVSGTHGKTTTTSMIAHILLEADTDPTISIGGKLDAIGGNIRKGDSEVFLAEACEYTNSFLELHPMYSIILDIEEDHPDFFKDLADIRNSFRLFLENTHPERRVSQDHHIAGLHVYLRAPVRDRGSFPRGQPAPYERVRRRLFGLRHRRSVYAGKSAPVENGVCYIARIFHGGSPSVSGRGPA
jgi:UDP-N-acetylmuramate--alanine ligase